MRGRAAMPDADLREISGDAFVKRFGALEDVEEVGVVGAERRRQYATIRGHEIARGDG